MGARGTPKTPTKILKLRGSWRAKMRGSEPEPPLGRPDCPEYLGDDGRREWARVTGILESLGMLTELDQSMLGLYCKAYEEFLEADRQVRRTGLLVRQDDKINSNPLVRIRSDAWMRALRAAREFGLTPSARASIGETRTETKTGKERFFAG